MVLAAIGAAAGNHDWLNLATLIQVSLLTVAMALSEELQAATLVRPAQQTTQNMDAQTATRSFLLA